MSEGEHEQAHIAALQELRQREAGGTDNYSLQAWYGA